MMKCVHCGRDSDEEMCDSCYVSWVKAWSKKPLIFD